MYPPVDLSNLREMTDGDVELEAALFDTFYSSSEHCLNQMKAALGAHDNEGWRKAAHALKGTALNLGAMELGASCKEAQDEAAALDTEKFALLTRIEAQIIAATNYLKNLPAA